ncbi:TorF family putative porin [Sphingomonas sp.]|uniref:TorF family putative porin n=1 Tax=Sphingomonas sp. TaxID=28214 RepID=UPI002C6F0E59|nr:TorF family putative porin [Sphingomonas sp.]HTG39765.1 TorF family putative porin [Sphingomonas sp.]
MVRNLMASVGLVAAQPLLAQETVPSDPPPAPLAVSGSASLASDYRFRGVSQTDGNAAVQGGVTITHQSGVYAGTWGSNLAGWGTFGGANMELDLFAGIKLPVAAGTLDTGLVWYMYPGGADTTDFGELYARLSGAVGSATLTAGIAYAPAQRALGNVFATGAAAQAGVPDDAGDKEDNLYLSGDGVVPLAGTPVSLKAHIGYSDGNPGLGPNGTSIAPTGRYWDWSLGVDVTPVDGLTLGLAWVDTDISRAESAYLQPYFSRGQNGTGTIAGSTLLATLTASF